MIIRLKSENPNLLSVLNKNPNNANGLQFFDSNKNVYIGNCVSENEYHLFSHEKYKIGKQMTAKPYVSPSNALKMLKTFFSHLLKTNESVFSYKIDWLGKTIGEIDTFPLEISIENVYCDSNWYRRDSNSIIFQKHFENVEVEQTGYNLISLKYTGKNIYQAINVFYLMLFMIELSNKEREYKQSGQIEKVFQVMLNVNRVPYFMIYLFLKRISNITEIKPEWIEKFQEKYENDFGQKLTLTGVGTHQARINFVSEKLDVNNVVLDFGCGEFQHLKGIKNKVEKYVGYDVEDYTSLYNKWNNSKDGRYNGINWEFTTDLNTLEDVPYSVIMSEVFEHVEYPVNTIRNFLSDYNVKQLIITTPDKNFNKHYNLDDDEVRRHDHLRELNFNEFMMEINYLLVSNEKYLDNRYHVEYRQVGDKISNDAVSSAAILTKRSFFNRIFKTISNIFNNEK